jgi:uncharacterized protein YfcZ (UPF0381/DUF406 family)
MKMSRLPALLSILSLVLSGLALAQETQWGYPDKDEQQVEVMIDKNKVSPLLKRIIETREEAEQKIAQLKEELLKADETRRFELQKQVEQIKLDSEIKILKIRLSAAQEKNDSKTAQEIQHALENLLNPPVFPEDVDARGSREHLQLTEDQKQGGTR